MAPSGQARTHALQRVQTSRSIGFSCCHSTSKSPSHPESFVTRPDHTGYLRSSGSSPLLPETSTLTASCDERRSAQSSAASAGPMMRSSPSDLKSTAGIGSGSGSVAMATSAAILGIACVPRAPQPACSRTLTNFTGFFDSASSPKSAASCVHATITSSPAPRAAWNAAASLRDSGACTAIGSAAPSAAESALASIATVRLQLQTLSVLASRLIVFRFCLCFLLLFGFFLRLREEHRARLVERGEKLGGDRLAHGPVARERLE